MDISAINMTTALETPMLFLFFPVLFLFVIIFIVGVPAAAIAKDKSKRTIGRKSFLLWNIGTFLVFILALFLIFVSGAIQGAGSGPAAIISILLPLLAFALWVLGTILRFWILPRRVLWRVRDTGWKPDLSYTYTVPMAHLILAILLLFVPSAASSADSPH